MSPGRSLPLQPRPDPDTAGFWQATANGELALCWCPDCDRFTHPPLERCPDCGGEVTFKAVSGKGSVYSFIVVGRAVIPGTAPGDVIALVELVEQEGLRLISRLEGVAAADVRIGQPVEAAVVPLPGGEFRIPAFRPA